METDCNYRSHAIVLLSRLEGFDPELAEALLRPRKPLFEYWGPEASWIPIELYPVFEFRRKAFRRHPWWGDLIGQHPKIAENLCRRIRDDVDEFETKDPFAHSIWKVLGAAGGGI